MSSSTIDGLLDQLQSQLALDTEMERDLLDELRSHLEDALEQASNAEAEPDADVDKIVQEVAARFGLEATGAQLQQVHAGWGTADAVFAAALPVLCALVLRWLVFAPDGTSIGWNEVLVRPAFWIVAVAALLIPLIKMGRWRYGLVSWSFFWLITVLFTVLPSARW